MKKINILIFVLVIITAILALSIFLKNSPLPVRQTEQHVQNPAPQPVKTPIVHYPVPIPPPLEEQAAIPEKAEESQPPVPILPAKLPPIEQSDKSIQDALKNLKIESSIFKLMLLENFIQRFVVTIDNLPEKRLPRAHLPINPPKKRFITSGTVDAPQTSQRNLARYNAHVKLLEALDVDLVIKVYIHFYSLFQAAYEQLGYQNAYFNDRLVNVIDHLLETPNPPEPILLAQPSVLYTYADPLLEKLSSGQKILLRIGPDHRQKVKNILQSYRNQLVDLQP